MKLPESPKAPAWLQKIQYLTNPIGYLESNSQRYGDMFNTPILGNSDRLWLVSHPEALKQLFTREGKEIYACGNELGQFLLGEKSLAYLEGDAHQRDRKLLMPSFQQKSIRTYGQIICELTEQIFSQLTPGTTFSAHSMLDEIDLLIMLKIVFGIYEKQRFQELKELIKKLLNSLTSPFIYSSFILPFLRKDLGAWSPWGYFRRLIEKIDQLIYTEIRERRIQNNPATTDILTLLLSAVDEEGNRMSDEQLRDQLITLVVAGHDTNVASISWALYWIYKNPEVRRNLLEELATIHDSAEATTISTLPYLTAVCYESLRIYPVPIITIPREVKEPVELMGYQLEPGTRVYGSIYLTHHREDLYPEPKKFKPERFLERQYTPYEFLPFGGGSRRCLGEHLALFEMKLVLATILSNYQLALVDGQSVKPQMRGFNIAPSGGVKMVFKEKRKA